MLSHFGLTVSAAADRPLTTLHSTIAVDIESRLHVELVRPDQINQGESRQLAAGTRSNSVISAKYHLSIAQLLSVEVASLKISCQRLLLSWQCACQAVVGIVAGTGNSGCKLGVSVSQCRIASNHR